MKKTSKYFYMIAGVILTLFTGIMAIIITANIAPIINSVNKLEELIIIPKYHILLFICISVALLLIFLATIVFFICAKRDPKNNQTFQLIMLVLTITVFAIIAIAYYVIMTEGFIAICDSMKAEFGLTTEELTAGDEVKMYVAEIFGQLFMLTLLHTICAVVTSALFVKYSKYEEQKEETIEDTETVETVVTPQPEQPKELSATEQIKKEIEDMKQALELQKLKDEYAELYKELNKKKKQ